MNKRTIGVSVAAAYALLAEGKNFSRTELNAMLDKLAASPEPTVRRGTQAMCYARAEPRPERFEYVCKKCGTHTVYPANTLQMANTLARFRNDEASLRALGLDITLDESALCQKCKSAKELGTTTHGRVIAEPKNEQEKQWFHWRVGEEVEIISYGSDYCWVLTPKRELWVQAQHLSGNGKSNKLIDVRLSPSSGGKIFCRAGTFKQLPARPGDPKDWVRVDLGNDGRREIRGESISTKYLGEFSYDENHSPSLSRIDRLAWVIDGKRTVVRKYDAKILRAFLTGKETWIRDFGETVPVKNSLNRLRELLDPAYIKPMLPTKDAKKDVHVEVDI